MGITQFLEELVRDERDDLTAALQFLSLDSPSKRDTPDMTSLLPLLHRKFVNLQTVQVRQFVFQRTAEGFVEEDVVVEVHESQNEREMVNSDDEDELLDD